MYWNNENKIPKCPATNIFRCWDLFRHCTWTTELFFFFFYENLRDQWRRLLQPCHSDAMTIARLDNTLEFTTPRKDSIVTCASTNRSHATANMTASACCSSRVMFGWAPQRRSVVSQSKLSAAYWQWLPPISDTTPLQFVSISLKRGKLLRCGGSMQSCVAVNIKVGVVFDTLGALSRAFGIV